MRNFNDSKIFNFFSAVMSTHGKKIDYGVKIGVMSTIHAVELILIAITFTFGEMFLKVVQLSTIQELIHFQNRK